MRKKMHQFEPESATLFGERDMRSAARRRRWCLLCSRTNRSIRFCAFASRLEVESTCSSISLMSLGKGKASASLAPKLRAIWILPLAGSAQTPPGPSSELALAANPPCPKCQSTSDLAAR